MIKPIDFSLIELNFTVIVEMFHLSFTLCPNKYLGVSGESSLENNVLWAVNPQSHFYLCRYVDLKMLVIFALQSTTFWFFH